MNNLIHRVLSLISWGVMLSMLSLAYTAPLIAQIQAPNLICVDNDTLVWETPGNTCGPFLGYIVYGSRNEGGPYAAIDTVSNPTQTSYYHEGAGGALWYYYMESDFNCPGLSRLRSDTLDNRIPEIGPLLSASVEGGGVILNWAPSPSPETAGYIIARNTSTGTTIIDTVYDQTSYIDLKAAADVQAETYFVTAIDRCGNTSLVGSPHSTMLLKAGEIDECDQSIGINWSAYKGWDKGPTRYEILVSANGAPPVVAGSVPGNTTSYIFTNANDGETYCFTIRAVETDGGANALSNIICQTPDVVQPIRELVMQNVTYNQNGDVAITWRWNTNAQLRQAVISRSVDNSAFAPIFNIDLNAPRLAENIFTDADLPANASQICYRVETTDQCDDRAVSGVGCAIHLTSVSDGQGANRITWTPFDLGQPNTPSYELFRVQDGVAVSLGDPGDANNSFIDQVDLNNNISGTTCYYIIATASFTDSSGDTRQITSRSNTACTEQGTNIYIPNAFAPGGLNTEFRTYLQFGDPSSFLLEIYDRWGSKVFSAQSIDQGWDGTKNGEAMPVGVYIYRLVLKQSNGVVIERAGSVALIR